MKQEKVWEDRIIKDGKKEPPTSFKYLQTYLKMENRSLKKVAETWQKHDRYIRNLSSRWDWVARAEAYDEYMFKQELELTKKERLDNAQSIEQETKNLLENFNKIVDLRNKFLEQVIIVHNSDLPVEEKIERVELINKSFKPVKDILNQSKLFTSILKDLKPRIPDLDVNIVDLEANVKKQKLRSVDDVVEDARKRLWGSE